jgi:hypothetical protein
MKPSRILALALVLPVGSALAQPCEDVSAQPQSLAAQLMNPGSFRLTLVATRGRKIGGITEGVLELRPTSSSDKSPQTGELASDRNIADVPLYGWVTADWRLIDAPVGDERAGSRDPVFPGVLAIFASWKEGYSSRTPVLLISTVSNRRAGEIMTDGGGIGLWVRKLDERGFAGEWSGWGIAISGSGYFCATPLSP